MVKRILGGLADDNPQPMSDAMRQEIRGNWQRIEKNIPGVKFNFDFWDKCVPRRSTYPACRAVIAARQQGLHFETEMIEAIQHAYYCQARNPSNEETLQALAIEIGLDSILFSRDLESEAVNNQLMSEINFSRNMFVDSFPSLVLVVDEKAFPVEIDYNDSNVMLDNIFFCMNKLRGN